MKRKTILAMVLISLCFLSSGLVADNQPQERVMNFIAVMDFKCGKNVDKAFSAPLTNVVIDELVKNKKYTVIDRANRDKILSEAGFQMTACVDENCTIEAGRILGVGKIVIGSVDFIDKNYLVNLQIINVQTAAVEMSSMKICECDFKGLIETVRNAARELVAEPQIHTAPGITPETPNAPATPKNIGKCPEDMAYIPEGNFCMDIYEYPNKKGEIPTSGFTWFQAVKTCEKLGKRLPDEIEWQTSCEGPLKKNYPYGNAFDWQICKYATWYDNPVPSGSMERCVSDYGVYDLSGNLWEWTNDIYEKKGLRVIKGGGIYHSRDGRLSCRFKGYDSENAARIYLGFRCAKDVE